MVRLSRFWLFIVFLSCIFCPIISWGDNSPDDKYSIRFEEADLRDAITFLAEISGMNVIVPPDMSGVVTVQLNNISVADAMYSIIKAHGFEYAIENNIIRIGKGESFAGAGEDLKTHIFKLRYASASELQEKVKLLLSKRGAVLADERTNSLIVRGVAANIGNVKRLVEEVDTRDIQILIESKIVESSRSFARRLGVQWGVTSSPGRVSVSGLSKVGESESGRNLMVKMDPFGSGEMPTSGLGLIIGSLAAGTNIDLALSAAEEKGDVQIISEPSIVTSNGKEATIRSGETLLVATSGDINIGSTSGASVSGGGSNVEEIETGVELRVTPQVAANGFIRLDIEAETSQADFSRSVEGLPVIVDNTANTVVMIKDGETTVIGGLFKFNESRSRKGVPLLSKIPILGNLFKSRSRSKGNSELMIFIKPTIVKDVSQIPVQARIREVEISRRRLIIPSAAEEKAKRRLKKASDKSRVRSKSKYLRYRHERGM